MGVSSILIATLHGFTNIVSMLLDNHADFESVMAVMHYIAHSTMYIYIYTVLWISVLYTECMYMNSLNILLLYVVRAMEFLRFCSPR